MPRNRKFTPPSLFSALFAAVIGVVCTLIAIYGYYNWEISYRTVLYVPCGAMPIGSIIGFAFGIWSNMDHTIKPPDESKYKTGETSSGGPATAGA
jgi:hypothetical protein